MDEVRNLGLKFCQDIKFNWNFRSFYHMERPKTTYNYLTNIYSHLQAI